MLKVLLGKTCGNIIFKLFKISIPATIRVSVGYRRILNKQQQNMSGEQHTVLGGLTEKIKHSFDNKMPVARVMFTLQETKYGSSLPRILSDVHHTFYAQI